MVTKVIVNNHLGIMNICLTAVKQESQKMCQYFCNVSKSNDETNCHLKSNFLGPFLSLVFRSEDP